MMVRRRPSRSTSKKGESKRLRLPTCIAFTGFLFFSPALAQDAIKGRDMAQTLCGQCHMNEGQGEKHGAMGIPSFSAVANRAGQTEQDVVIWLQSIPPMMPNHHLSQDEMYALAAFITHSPLS